MGSKYLYRPSGSHNVLVMFPVSGLLGFESKQFVKRSTKAALLSGLVFPGIGHMYLRRHIHGIILSVGAASAIYFTVSVAVNAALVVAEKIQSGGVPLDMGTITDLVSQQSSVSMQSTNIAMIALVACWVIGIADSYRQGRAQEKGEKLAGENKEPVI